LHAFSVSRPISTTRHTNLYILTEQGGSRNNASCLYLDRIRGTQYSTVLMLDPAS
jgi:hypothetical protein